VRVGWLEDRVEQIGGAELTGSELFAAPEGLEIIACPPGGIIQGMDVYVLMNVTQYGPDDRDRLWGSPLVKFCHDQWPHGDPDFKAFVLEHAALTFCSPTHKEKFPHHHEDPGIVIPPPMKSAAYREDPGEDRSGVCSIASWMNPGKGAPGIESWAARNGPVDIYGPGPFRPVGKNIIDHGILHESQVSTVLYQHESFIFLPWAFEPFGRCTYEARLAGCKTITNGLIGSDDFEIPDPRIESAAEDFWSLVRERAG
jgi:hypothetical protein